MNQPSINNVKLSFTCDQNWDEMAPIPNGKFCNACQKPVYDMTNEKVEVFRKLLAENKSGLCGKFRRSQLAEPEDVKPKWRKWLAAAMIAVSFGSLSGCTKEIYSLPLEAIKTPELSDNMVFGYIEATSIKTIEFPGGDKALRKFLQDNIRYTEKMPTGKVYVSFIVKTDGTLSDIKIARGLTEETNQEILRVLSLSPKWISASHDGKSYEARYALPLSFPLED